MLGFIDLMWPRDFWRSNVGLVKMTCLKWTLQTTSGQPLITTSFDTNFVECNPLYRWLKCTGALHWRHNDRDDVSNHRRLDCCSTVCSDAAQRKHQSSASLAFVMGIHRWPVDYLNKGPVTRKCFQSMTTPCERDNSLRLGDGCVSGLGPLLVRS